MNKIVLLLLLTLVSCGINKYTTKFTDSSNDIDQTKGYIISKYGTPFKIDITKKKSEIEQVIFYKERVYVDVYDYILTTKFFISNDKVYKIKQEESLPPKSNVIIEKSTDQ